MSKIDLEVLVYLSTRTLSHSWLELTHRYGTAAVSAALFRLYEAEYIKGNSLTLTFLGRIVVKRYGL